MSWDFLGGLFDLNRDGETDIIEQAIGFTVLDEMSREDEDEDNN